jgi:aspartate kinase
MTRVTVHKFGGTSVADAERFDGVAAIVADRNGPASSPAVVVSAMARVTDALIDGARRAADGDRAGPSRVLDELTSRHLAVAEALLGPSERAVFEADLHERLETIRRLYDSLAVLGELTPRGRDAVMGHGERLSSVLLAAVLRTRGLLAEAIDATGLVVTDDRFGAATPHMEPTCERIRTQVAPLIERGTIPVITGYIAATEDGIPTTLGRSGSDRSAAIVAAGLDADEVWIWTDVDGILTADPHIVAEARTLEELSYDEAANLARFGAEVLHPRTIRPVIASGIPLRIANSFRPDRPGTRIVPEPSPGRWTSPAIVSANGMRLLSAGDGDEAGRLQAAARTLRRLSEAGIDVRMFSLALCDSSLGFVIREQDHEHVLSILRRGPRDADESESLNVRTEEDVAIVSVIGGPGEDERGIASRAFAALGRHEVRVIAVTQAVASDSVSFCIPADRAADTVCFLHRELGLGSSGGAS